MHDELYKKYRPSKFSEVVGQREAVQQLIEMGKRKAVPHTLLFSGPSGCGKTTLARILRLKLGCSDFDYMESNFSDARGIDEVRGMRSRANILPISGPCRVWLIDECHGMTSDAQNAILKLLEDTPAHLYIMLCTTEPQKLKRTIITRSTQIKCKEIAHADLKALVLRVAAAEEKPVSDAVANDVATAAQGSAREALVMLHAILGIPEDEQLNAISGGPGVTKEAIDVARALMKSTTRWNDVQATISKLVDNPETVRRVIMAYCRTVLLGKNGDHRRASLIMEELRDPFHDLGSEFLVLSCYNIINS